MIRLDKRPAVAPVKDPENLIPVVYRCLTCGSTIRKIEETQSFVLMTLSKQVEEGTRKICPFCYRLKEFRGIES
jgi:DNA-directed RNA polymerase subunit RPC12/RpoP